MFHDKGPTFFELIKQALSSTDAGYDQLAPKFEFTPFRTPDMLLAAAADYSGAFDRGLDLCCGTGAGMKAFRPHCREWIAGVDRSAGMLVQAHAQLAGGSGAPFILSQGDALKLPFRAQSFDLLTCFGAFGHILEDDEPAMVAEIARVLRAGGKFVFITTDLPPLWHPARLLPMGFNAAMRLRNALIKPEFVMYYLTFLLPRARDLLGEAGFSVDAPFNVLPPPFSGLRLVVATKRSK